MKKILKNSTYLTTGIVILFMLISTIVLACVHNNLCFTILYIFNILSVCGVLIFNLVKKDSETLSYKYTYMSVFLLVSLFFILIDNLTIYLGWDLNIYDNLMYFTNIKMYSIVYAIFTIIFALYDIYVVILEKIKNTPMPINLSSNDIKEVKVKEIKVNNKEKKTKK